MQILDQLRAAGLGQALVVDLTKPQTGISVVRVIVPGLEAARDDGRYFPGARARSAARARPVQG